MRIEWIERYLRYFPVVSGVPQVFWAGREKEVSPRPEKRLLEGEWRYGGCRSGALQASEGLEALLCLGLSSFFLGLLPHYWKRLKGRPGNLSGKKNADL